MKKQFIGEKPIFQITDAYNTFDQSVRYPFDPLVNPIFPSGGGYDQPAYTPVGIGQTPQENTLISIRYGYDQPAYGDRISSGFVFVDDIMPPPPPPILISGGGDYDQPAYSPVNVGVGTLEEIRLRQEDDILPPPPPNFKQDDFSPAYKDPNMEIKILGDKDLDATLQKDLKKSDKVGDLKVDVGSGDKVVLGTIDEVKEQIQTDLKKDGDFVDDTKAQTKTVSKNLQPYVWAGIGIVAILIVARIVSKRS